MLYFIGAIQELRNAWEREGVFAITVPTVTLGEGISMTRHVYVTCLGYNQTTYVLTIVTIHVFLRLLKQNILQVIKYGY